MYLQDILPKMSKLYLGRTVDSFLKDVHMDTEEEMREVILRNVEEFQNKERVKKYLDFSDEQRDIILLNEMILMSLMEKEGYLLNESELYHEVNEIQQEIIKQSSDELYMEKIIPDNIKRIYKSVLSEAWKKDDSLNAHEINILNVLRDELELSKRDHYLLESQIGRFPQKGNKPHTHQQISRSLINLQSRGLILRFREDTTYFIIPEDIARILRYEMGGELRKEVYETLLSDLSVVQLKEILSKIGRFPQKGNKPHTHQQISRSLINLQSRGLILRFREDTTYFIIPEDIARILRYEMGGELRKEVYETLLSDLSVVQLKEILSNLDFNVSGVKEKLVQRIIQHNILPSTALKTFSSVELTEILRGLEGTKVSGKKREKVQNIIDYYEMLSSPLLSDPTDNRARLYDFFVELASRDYKTLRINKVIEKDVQVDKYFEDATRYLFENKLGNQLVKMDGT